MNIYYSPVFNSGQDMSLLYPKPESLSTNLGRSLIRDDMPKALNLFSCPASFKKIKNIIVFKSPMDMEYEYEYSDNNKFIKPLSPGKLEARIIREPIFDNGPMIALSLDFILFAEEDVECSFTPPYFHKPQHMNYGSALMGEFNIGSWFRPYSYEFQTWSNSGNFIIKENEPLLYAELKTDKKIKLIHFNMNQTLKEYMKTCVNSTELFGIGQSLESRYNRFKNTRMREKILAEIKKNVF